MSYETINDTDLPNSRLTLILNSKSGIVSYHDRKIRRELNAQALASYVKQTYSFDDAPALRKGKIKVFLIRE